VEHIDLFPTICELTGADCPSSVHGRSLTPLLGSQAAPNDWRDAVFSQIGDVQMIRTEKEKLNVYDGEPGEYYNLEEDSREFQNRIADPECSENIEGLEARLGDWERAHGKES